MIQNIAIPLAHKSCCRRPLRHKGVYKRFGRYSAHISTTLLDQCVDKPGHHQRSPTQGNDLKNPDNGNQLTLMRIGCYSKTRGLKSQGEWVIVKVAKCKSTRATRKDHKLIRVSTKMKKKTRSKKMPKSTRIN